MNSSKDYIIKQLNELHKTFRGVKVRYEYRDYLNTHLIEILPLETFENDHNFILKEMEIQDEFESLYGNKEEILFISSESLNEIRDVHFSLGYSAFSTIKLIEFESIIHTFCFEGNFDLITADNTSYALAA